MIATVMIMVAVITLGSIWMSNSGESDPSSAPATAEQPAAGDASTVTEFKQRSRETIDAYVRDQQVRKCSSEPEPRVTTVG